jgi:hypothetical protein
VSELEPQPVSFYAAVFFLVNATYIALIWELIEPTPAVTSAGVVFCHDFASRRAAKGDRRRT